jgi:hypothetical protein
MGRAETARVERWFIRQGIPHFIHGYSAGEDVLTRAVPVLSLVFLGELLLVFSDRFRGLAQAVVALLVLVAALAGVAMVNRIRGRRPFQLPDDVGPWELALFVLVPAALLAAAADDPIVGLAVAGTNVLVLVAVYLITSYGLVPMSRWAFARLLGQTGDLAPIIGRTLPLMLLFSAFLFVNAEIWQVASDAPGIFYGLVIGLLVSIGAVMVLLSLRNTLDEVNAFVSWAEVEALVAEGPGAGLPVPVADGPPAPPALDGRERINVALVLFITLAIKVLLVTLVIGLFYVVFGLLMIREETIAQWIAAGGVPGDDELWRGSLFGNEVVLTRQLLFVTGFITALSGLQFTAQVVNDAAFRAQFAEDMTAEMRTACAVRCLYLRALPTT